MIKINNYISKFFIIVLFIIHLIIFFIILDNIIPTRNFYSTNVKINDEINIAVNDELETFIFEAIFSSFQSDKISEIDYEVYNYNTYLNFIYFSNKLSAEEVNIQVKNLMNTKSKYLEGKILKKIKEKYQYQPVSLLWLIFNNDKYNILQDNYNENVLFFPILLTKDLNRLNYNYLFELDLKSKNIDERSLKIFEILNELENLKKEISLLIGNNEISQMTNYLKLINLFSEKMEELENLTGVNLPFLSYSFLKNEEHKRLFEITKFNQIINKILLYSENNLKKISNTNLLSSKNDLDMNNFENFWTVEDTKIKDKSISKTLKFFLSCFFSVLSTYLVILFLRQYSKFNI